MAVYFTSDTHFGHAGALSRFRRPFPSVAAMDEAMEAAWNATVGPDDEVWFLGDFALRLKPDAAGALLERLNGTKHLVAGNNDGPPTLKLPGWASVQHYAEIVVDGTLLVLCHYPFRTWNGMYKGALNLHGHSHGQLKGMTRQVDVGVDVWGFRPVTLAELRKPKRARAAGAAAGAATI
ncbi:metallophosphoesterase [Azospirillum sp.]|uniref:metallophosphoesterase n=1 Tax=Azospirillum sp. TaxID=34012 RepID=UPI002D6B6948|nr:metallophosphoesterase [Azospirillum sp.]HYD69769.1 metallophosphoesterase [Azospirillum sp.]